MRTFASILALILLGACGTKTSLVMPPRPAPAGATSSASPAPAATPADDSKPGGATSPR
ncbi:MAG: hypothetical protein KF853_04465 [Rhodocyclaceae bacterium]|nr:hypothetical protein [Rhodocyclaceae bacterium]MCW5596919.1 hypothetical protein [Rhodocyclaceae bacterium]